MMRDRPIYELKCLALQEGPEQYLALDELARRLRDDRLIWWSQTTPCVWSPIEITRAPSAIEVEWVLLELSRQYNEGSAGQGPDYKLIGAQDKRLDSIKEQLQNVEESVEIRHRLFNYLQARVRQHRNGSRKLSKPSTLPANRI